MLARHSIGQNVAAEGMRDLGIEQVRCCEPCASPVGRQNLGAPAVQQPLGYDRCVDDDQGKGPRSLRIVTAGSSSSSTGSS